MGLTQDLEKDLEIISNELENELQRAERELEMEHTHLKGLIGNSDPAVQEQIAAMEDSLSRLYNGIEKTRMYLHLAQGESYILRQELLNPSSSRRILIS